MKCGIQNIVRAEGWQWIEISIKQACVQQTHYLTDNGEGGGWVVMGVMVLSNLSVSMLGAG